MIEPLLLETSGLVASLTFEKGQCEPSVTIGQKIGVNEQDVTATYEVMVEATTLLKQRLVQWASET